MIEYNIASEKRPHVRRHPVQTLLLAGAMAAIVWGALAFGAVYPWAYTPLAIACATIGLVALIVERRGRPTFGPLALGVVAIAVTIGLQLVPLPLPVLMRVSPGTDAFLSRYDFSYQLARAGTLPDGTRADEPLLQPVSIAPDKTLRGAVLFTAFALFLLGSSRLLSVVSARTMTRWLIAFGSLLAMIGIVQRGLTANDLHPLIYGFWKPQYDAATFGPFVNPNHFAGWMVMMLPLALAALFDAALQTVDASPRRGNRLAVLASPQASAMLLLGVACLVMALSLLMTRSRSGLATFAMGSVLAAAIVFRRQSSSTARAAVVASVLLLLIGTASWAGLDTMVTKFTEPQGRKSLASREGAWKDTAAIIRQFPLTGSGLDTYGTAMMVYQTGNPGLHFQEAHNDYLQLAAEGGLLVGVPVLITLGIFVRDIRRRFREAPKVGTTYCLRVGAVVGMISIALQSLVEFSLQMPGNAALFAMLAAIALHQSPNLRPVPPSPSGRARPPASNA